MSSKKKILNATDFETPKWSMLIALIWLSLLGYLSLNIQPMFLGALSVSYDFNASQLGFLGGAELGGACLASLFALYWFPRLNLSRVAFLALLVAVLGNLLTGWVTNFSYLIVLRFFTAFFGVGMLNALILGLVGLLKNPERVIAIAIICQVLSISVAMVGIPLLLERWEMKGIAICLALVFMSGFCALKFLFRGKSLILGNLSLDNNYITRILPMVLLAGLIVFSIGVGSIWAFLERIGNGAGFSMTDTGQALALGSFIGALGALLAAVIGQRIGNLIPILIGLFGLILVCFMFVSINSWLNYTIAAVLLNFFWNLILPYLLGSIASSDRSGRFMVLVPAAQGGGYALGPVISGLVIVGNNYSTSALIAAVAFVISLVIIVPVIMKLSYGEK